MQLETMRIQTGNPYDILIGRGLIHEAGAQIAQRIKTRRALIVTDENVDVLYGAGVEASLKNAGIETDKLVLPAGEETKSLEKLGQVYSALCDAQITRSDILVALGGGVMGDLGGFAAATYLRGIRYVQIPTTLLAQVDSAVGGKTAIDLPEGKNLAGAFHQPALVLIDPDTLDTLPDHEFTGGMGEVIKYAFTFDADLCTALADSCVREDMQPVIRRCLEYKKRVVENDERDFGERMLLNFGHTLGHAVEVVQHYQGYSHGQAVAIGMHLITRLSQAKLLTEQGTADALENMLMRWKLPTTCDKSLWHDMQKALLKDKKNLDGSLNVIILTHIGHAEIKPVDLTFFEEVTQWLK